MFRNKATTGKMHEDEGLGDWREVSFHKKATKSSFLTLTVPARFVREHGDKFQRFVILQSEAEGDLWTVKVGVSFPHGRPQVYFIRGWKKFVVFNGLVEGDRMTFTLVAKSKFKVSISRSSENSKAWPRLQALETGLKEKKLLRRPSFVAVTEKPEDLKCDELNGRVARDCGAVKADTVVRSISNASAAAAGFSLSSSSDTDSHFFEPVQAKTPLPIFC